MGLAVVGGHGPVLLDRRVRRYGQAIRLVAVERGAVLVSDRDQVHLTDAQTFDADVPIGVGEPAAVDRVRVRVGVRVLRRYHEVGKDWVGPAAVRGEVRRKARIVLLLEPYT